MKIYATKLSLNIKYEWLFCCLKFTFCYKLSLNIKYEFRCEKSSISTKNCLINCSLKNHITTSHYFLREKARQFNMPDCVFNADPPQLLWYHLCLAQNPLIWKRLRSTLKYCDKNVFFQQNQNITILSHHLNASNSWLDFHIKLCKMSRFSSNNVINKLEAERVDLQFNFTKTVVFN